MYQKQILEKKSKNCKQQCFEDLKNYLYSDGKSDEINALSLKTVSLFFSLFIILHWK